MKNVLVVHHGSSVSKEELDSFLNVVPEAMKSGAEIEFQPQSEMPVNMISATPKRMKELGMDLINKNKKR